MLAFSDLLYRAVQPPQLTTYVTLSLPQSSVVLRLDPVLITHPQIVRSLYYRSLYMYTCVTHDNTKANGARKITVLDPRSSYEASKL